MTFATWKPVQGYEGRYLVSDSGRILSLLTKKILHASPNTHGYLRVGLYNGQRRQGIDWPVHIIVLNNFVGPCPEGMEARHLDGDRANPRLENLIWGTPSENAEDKIIHGTINRGETHGCHKLTENQVLAIRKDFRRLKDIANDYGVTMAAISLIRRRESWRHLS